MIYACLMLSNAFSAYVTIVIGLHRAQQNFGDGRTLPYRECYDVCMITFVLSKLTGLYTMKGKFYCI